MNQMSIFDFMPENPLDSMSEQEMVDIISGRTGIPFVKSETWRKYEAKMKNVTYRVGFSNYALPDKTDRFISCGYDTKNSGSGRPCDSIDEAVAFFIGDIKRREWKDD